MSHSHTITASSIAIVSDIQVHQGQTVIQGQPLLMLHIMGTDLPIVAPQAGVIRRLLVSTDDEVETEQALIEIDHISHSDVALTDPKSLSSVESALYAFRTRQQLTLDEARTKALSKRQGQGYRSARQNLADLCDVNSFMEYGQFAVAAQRQRRDYQELKSATAADGIITGVGGRTAKITRDHVCRGRRWTTGRY